MVWLFIVWRAPARPAGPGATRRTQTRPPRRPAPSPCFTASFRSFSSCFAAALDCARIFAAPASASPIFAVSFAARSLARRSGSPPALSILAYLGGGGVEGG
jgi:hypothetical protein